MFKTIDGFIRVYDGNKYYLEVKSMIPFTIGLDIL